MADRYANIRRALEMGPTPGPWIVTHELRECDETVCDLVNGTWIVTASGVKLAHWEYDAALIAACDPDTIRALLAERDALLEACCLAARYLNPDQFPDAVKKIDAAIAAANGGGND